MRMFPLILFNLAIVALFVYAIRVCRQKQAFATQPATLTSYVFIALLVKSVMGITLSLLVGGRAYGGVMVFFNGLHWLLLAALVYAALAWRDRPFHELKELKLYLLSAAGLKAMSVGIPLLVRHMTQGQSMRELEHTLMMSSLVTGALNFSVYVLLLLAIFRWRGYPEPEKEPVPVTTDDAMPTSPVPGSMFNEEDYIPFLAGVMTLGGLLVIPFAWGQFMGIPYGESLFSSLVSCAIFCASHDKRGRFLWGRFIGLLLLVFVSVMRSVSRYGGQRPFFLAGGILGFIVMLGCGWAGIAVTRFVRKHV